MRIEVLSESNKVSYSPSAQFLSILNIRFTRRDNWKVIPFFVENVPKFLKQKDHFEMRDYPR